MLNGNRVHGGKLEISDSPRRTLNNSDLPGDADRELASTSALFETCAKHGTERTDKPQRTAIAVLLFPDLVLEFMKVHTCECTQV